ncbi:MAG: alpha-glucan family phosphorylase, partial [Bacillota bacterium]
LHGQTAQHMWKDVTNAAPIIAITNGVHTGTWQDARIRNAYETGADLWLPHMEAKKELLAAVQARTGAQLNPDNLLIGFARRAVPYKRSDLIFSNPEVIEPYLCDGRIQIIFSGKAHPLDDQGKAIVARLVSFSKAYPNSVVFLENYDMEIGRLLTRGTDVWLNNPKRPLEASGTSGMKAAMNGILNVSVLDGWWPEGCIHGVNGWEFGHGYEGPLADEIDLAGLYQVMLDQVAPTFYENRPQWVRMMRAAIDMSVERFSASRMLQEYYSRMYVDMVKRQERVQ